HRLVDLVRCMDDAAEPVLSDPRTRFVVPVPSRGLRRHLEAERARRAARTLGLAHGPAAEATAPYDPELYRAVYQHVLRRRHVDLLRVHTILPASAMSPYDLGVSVDDLRPRADE